MSEAPQIKLHTLGGQSPARELGEDAARLLGLPEAARARIWEVLGPSLPDPIPREVERKVKRFAEAHDAPPPEVARALRSARVLVRLASAIDLPADRFAEDLRALGGAPLADAILPGYERGKAEVRAEIARQTIAEHGRLLEGVKWRLDVLSASDRGLGMRVPVVTLTLTYREAGRRGQVSFQVLPDVLKQLRGVCDRFLSRK